MPFWPVKLWVLFVQQFEFFYFMQGAPLPRSCVYSRLALYYFVLFTFLFSSGYRCLICFQLCFFAIHAQDSIWRHQTNQSQPKAQIQRMLPISNNCYVYYLLIIIVYFYLLFYTCTPFFFLYLRELEQILNLFKPNLAIPLHPTQRRFFSKIGIYFIKKDCY